MKIYGLDHPTACWNAFLSANPWCRCIFGVTEAWEKAKGSFATSWFLLFGLFSWSWRRFSRRFSATKPLPACFHLNTRTCYSPRCRRAPCFRWATKSWRCWRSICLSFLLWTFLGCLFWIPTLSVGFRQREANLWFLEGKEYSCFHMRRSFWNDIYDRNST